jgi:hypothetical protein
MFKRRTLFIVGAGASAEVGFPVGTGLARIIGKKLGLEVDNFGHIGRAADPDFFQQFYRAYQSTIGEYFTAFRIIREGILLSNSIDDFLNIHSGNARVVEVGKAAIVRSIIEAETHSLLFVNPSNIFNKLDYSKVEPTWFLKLMRVLGPGVTVPNVKQLLEDVSFIVFNYDRSIEHFLTHAIQQLYAIGKKDAAAIVDATTIIHPYGSIGSLDAVPFGGDEHRNFDFLALSKGIKTYTEQIEEGETIEKIQGEVRNAKSIVFLGFAFHDQNMALLKPRRPLPNKEIYGTALHMSDADKSEVESQISKFFPAEKIGGLNLEVFPTAHIHIENKLACAGLFDSYAKSIGG